MIPDYREPHPWALKNKRALDSAALSIGAVLFVGFPSGPTWLILAFVGLMMLNVSAWSYFRHIILPDVSDYHDYLESRAKRGNNLAWLDSVNTDFKELWRMDPGKPVKEVLNE